MNWKEIYVSFDGKNFMHKGEKIFKPFLEVLKFHEPGIAPVRDASGAYPIDVEGNPIYSQRYTRTFGFYCNRAAVYHFNEWFHIDTKGNRIGRLSCAWVGNYQENACVVRYPEKEYFHVDLSGKRLYESKYRYAGDFKDGIACVKNWNDHWHHIKKNGDLLHPLPYFDLGVYHKNFATARDEHGWCHIDKSGRPIYNQRYAAVEPFYNGFALVTTRFNEKCIINEAGELVLFV